MTGGSQVSSGVGFGDNCLVVGRPPSALWRHGMRHLRAF
jgi:hypothetical protein